jgi:hypothetical protein
MNTSALWPTQAWGTTTVVTVAKVIQQILRHANVTTTMNIYVKLVSRDAQEAKNTLENEFAAVVLQSVAENSANGAKTAMVTVRKTLPLKAVRGNLAERGGFEAPVQVLACATV